MTNYPIPPYTVTISYLNEAAKVNFGLGSSVLIIRVTLQIMARFWGTGKVAIAGTSAQIFSGAGTVHNIEINNMIGLYIKLWAVIIKCLRQVYKHLP